MGGQERAERLGQKLGERIGVGQDPDLAGEAARIGAEVLAQPLGLAQYRARMGEQRAAGLRRHHTLPSAHQQLGAERPFHVADARRGGGQRQIGPRGAARDAAGVDHMAEQIEIGEIETHTAAFVSGEGRLRQIPIAGHARRQHIS